LPGVKVSLVDSVSDRVLANTVTDGGGKYFIKLPARKNYKLLFEKQGYFAKSAVVAIRTADTLITRDICLEGFVVNKPIVIENILYDFNRATLRPESLKALDGVVSIMRDNTGIKIELSSHTDSIGSAAYNMKLSQQRAQSCVDYIISKGIDKERIIARGYGKTIPVAPNSLPNGKDNPVGRQLNRRTEFKVIGQKQ
jgi:outer membrane protein OmpA-like peptidoglycan-associated protein